MKCEAAYCRTIYSRDPPREKAEAIYAQFRAGGVPSEDDYRTFQDYIFRVLIDQAGRLKLPVHFHSAVGTGDYFSLRNGNPLNLENVLRDPRYSNVNFVLIHGGYPYTLDMIWLTAAKKRLQRFLADGLLRLSLGVEEHPEAVDFAVPRKNHVRVGRFSIQRCGRRGRNVMAGGALPPDGPGGGPGGSGRSTPPQRRKGG